MLPTGFSKYVDLDLQESTILEGKDTLAFNLRSAIHPPP
jgi:hypothetical protein